MPKVLVIEQPSPEEKDFGGEQGEYFAHFQDFIREFQERHDDASMEDLLTAFHQFQHGANDNSQAQGVTLEDYLIVDIPLPLSFYIQQFGFEVEKQAHSLGAAVSLSTDSVTSGDAYSAVVVDFEHLEERPETIVPFLREYTRKRTPFVLVGTEMRNPQEFDNATYIYNTKNQAFVNVLYDTLLKHTEKKEEPRNFSPAQQALPAFDYSELARYIGYSTTVGAAVFAAAYYLLQHN